MEDGNAVFAGSSSTVISWRRPAIFFAAILAATLLFAVAASPSHAAREFVCEISGSPTGGPDECKADGNDIPGQPLEYATAIDSDSADNVWVTEYYGGFSAVRLRKYDADGELLAMFNGAGAWGASGEAPVYELSFSNALDQLYAFQWYSPTGAWGINPDGTLSGDNLSVGTGEGCCNVAADVDNSGGPHDGDVYVGNLPSAVARVNSDDTPDNFTHSAEYISGNRIIATPGNEVWQPSMVAVGPTGDIYALEGNVIHRFDESGEYIQKYEGPWEFPEGIAIDPINENLAVVERNNHKVFELSPGGALLQVITGATAGVPGGTFGGGEDVAFDTKGRLLVLTLGRVLVLEPAAQRPRITDEGVTGSTSTSTTVHAEIDPQGGPEVTKCEVEYGTSKAYGLPPVPCSPAPNYNAPQKVSAPLAGLTSEQTYHYRFVTTTTNGVKNGRDQIFTPHHVVELRTEPAVPVGATTATLNGSWVGAGEEVTYHFEWGPTKAYGNVTPAAKNAAAGKTTVSANLVGLEGERRYHFRLVASNGGGTSIAQNGSFSTTADHQLICQITGLDDEHDYPGECVPTASGIPGGPIADATGVVSDDEGNIWVMDGGNHRLLKFDPAGNFLLQNAGKGSWENEQQFRGLAYGETEDQIYVGGNTSASVWAVNADDGSYAGQVVKTKPTESLGQLDIAVDNSGGPHDGDVYATFQNYYTSRWHPDGTPSNWEAFGSNIKEGNRIVEMPGDEAPFSASSPLVGEDGDLWVVEGGQLYRIDESGALERIYQGLKGGELAFDPTSGNLVAFDGSESFYEYDLGLELVRTFSKSSMNYTEPNTAIGEIAFSPTGRIYTAGYGNGYRKADIFGASSPQPTITYDPETGPTRSQIEVHATVDPNAAAGLNECRIEYGTTFDFELGSIPCSPMPDPENHGPTDVSGLIAGLGVEQLYRYRVVIEKDSFERRGDHRSFTLHAVKDLVTEPATAVTTTTATLNGSFDADGPATNFYFEYGNTPGLGQKTAVPPGGAAPAGPGKVSIGAPIAELLPGSIYYYRVVAGNAAFGVTKGKLATLKTLSAPTIAAVSASEVNDTDVNLNALVNPNGFPTKYRFEYGTTPAYGGFAPIPEGELAAAETQQKIQVHLDNLTSGSTYHFRLVAESEQGVATSENQTFTFFPPSCPNAQVRQETGAAYLPDCRAYELVTPEDAGGIMLGPSGPTSPYATNPSRMGFMGFLGVLPNAGNPPNVAGDLYVAERSPTGWSSRYVGIPATEKFLVGGPPTGFSLGGPAGIHADRSMSEFMSWDNGVFPPQENRPGSMAPYVYDSHGKFVARLPTNLGDVPDGEKFTGDVKPSGDFTKFFFTSTNYAFASGGVIGAPGSVYRNDRDSGAVELISNLPGGGGPIPQDPAMTSETSEAIRIQGVSIDGSRALLSTLAPSGNHLYMWMDGETHDVSLGADDLNHGVTLIGMTDEATSVLFTSYEQLTGDDHDTSRDIYRWDAASKEVSRVSTGSGIGAGDTDECVALWTETPGCDAIPVPKGPSGGFFFSQNKPSDTTFGAANGELYFYSPEQLDGIRGLRGERNLYTVRDGEVQHVVTLRSDRPLERIQVSPSNDNVAFLTKSQLTAYDNKDLSEMYHYDIEARKLKCVSCIPSGAPPTVNVEASTNGLFMSDDGRTFFTTKDSLVDRDVNGLNDVYEFVEGRPQLISSGLATEDAGQGGLFGAFFSGLVGVSADGVDVYFTSFEGLVKQDRNGSFMRFYDARTGGGFPFNPPPPPCNAADECHGADSSPPVQPEITSQADLGPAGNVVQQKKAKKNCKKKAAKTCKKAKKHKKGRKRSSKGRRAGL